MRLWGCIIILILAWGGYCTGQNSLSISTPKSTFHTPTQLADYWSDTPIPLSAYTPQERSIQRLLNQQEAAVIAYAPVKEEVFWASREMDLTGQNGLVDALEITPYTWKWVELEMRKADGSELVMRLRRPHQWFWQTGADSLGQTVWIDLPEMGAQGWATVKRIWPQQLDTRLWEEHRQGDYAARPITGRFIHQSEDVWDFYFSHSDSAIGATANHPFWSEDQMAWVEVGELALGERVRLHGGETATLSRKVRRPGWHKVYNLEIWRDHNFHVGEGGVLVHNGCVDDLIDGAQRLPDTRGKTKLFKKSGGFSQANRDFDSLELTDVRKIETSYGPGRVGTDANGNNVVVRPGSSDGRPTLQINHSGTSRRTEIRYDQ